jgi:hypothetical protein
MAVVNEYCTRAQLQEQFGDAITALDVDLLDRAINATSRAIDEFCGRKFWQDAAVVAREYRPSDPYTVLVDDISTATGVVVKTDTTGDGTYATTWGADDFDLEPRNAAVVASGSTGNAFSFWQITAVDDKTFPIHSRRATLQVTARFGFSAIPVDVEAACLIKAASLFKRKDSPNGIQGVHEFGAVRISRFKDPDVTELLGPFVRYMLPEV